MPKEKIPKKKPILSEREKTARVTRELVRLGFSQREGEDLLALSGTRRERRQRIQDLSTLFAARRQGHMSATGRATTPDAKRPTSSPQPKDKSYKTGTYRLHWKGVRSSSGTSGIEPFITSRFKRGWSEGHVATRTRMGAWLKSKVQGFTNPFKKDGHGAENSHTLAGSLYGANDVLSAPPASIHQNTEWLAIEEGLKKLHAKSSKGLRVKGTAYVHASGEFKGMLKASRFKIYFGSKKVFDHVSMGFRGNIDKDEARALRERVASLSQSSSAVSLHGRSKGIFGNAPTLDQAKKGHRGSERSALFTDLMTPTSKRKTGVSALAYAQKMYPAPTASKSS